MCERMCFSGCCRVLGLITIFLIALPVSANIQRQHELEKSRGLTLNSLDCEYLLHNHNEFERPPMDGLNGFVTNRVLVTPEALLGAYSRGVFPWGADELGYGRWHRPPLRGVLFFNELSISRSDRKFLRKQFESGELRVTFDQAFEQVIELCSTVPRTRYDPVSDRKVPESTWITDQIKKAYTALHRQGLAHSVEVWRGDRLVGGLYGVFINGVFTGESMFFLEPNATKLAFYALISRLQENGHTFMDTQMAIGLARKWGAKYIPRGEFEMLLAKARHKRLEF